MNFPKDPPLPDQPTQLLEVSHLPRPNATGGATRVGRGGFIGATIAKLPKVAKVTAIAVTFALLATGSLFAGVAVGSTREAPAVEPSAVAPSQPATLSPTATPSPTAAATRPVPPGVAAIHLRTCSLAAFAADANLPGFQASVLNIATNEVLFDRNSATAARTSGVLKALTAAAALSALGPDHRISTRVVAGSTPGTVVLIGGGDPTLSALGAGAESVYRGAPKLSDLAAQVKAKSAVPITDLVLDSTLWDQNDNWDPSWDSAELGAGIQSKITALSVDGGRANPALQVSPRSANPVADAGAAFAADLGIPASGHITVGPAPASALPLGEVKSQPVSALIAYLLTAGDNTLAEHLARLSSKLAGGNGSAASLAQVIPAVITRFGLNAAGVSIRDGSGLSTSNAVPAAFIAQFMAKVSARTQGLDIVYDALSIAGKTGTLASRFLGSNAVARGAVNAVTGAGATEYSIAGVIHAADGTAVSFAFYALGAVNSRSIPALDAITRAVFSCGNNLSNN